MTKKNIIIYSIISVCVVIAALVIILVINANKSKASGTINLYISGYNNEVIFCDDVEFYEGEYLLDVLKRYVEVEMGEGNLEGMMVGINDCFARDVYTAYFKLVVNCEYALYGAGELALADKDEVRITYSSIDDWSTGC